MVQRYRDDADSDDASLLGNQSITQQQIPARCLCLPRYGVPGSYPRQLSTQSGLRQCISYPASPLLLHGSTPICPVGSYFLAYTTDGAAEGAARMLKGDWILYKTNDIS